MSMIGAMIVFGMSQGFAADVTDMPEKMRGDLSIDYFGAFLSGSLEESVRNADGSLDQWGYGRRKGTRHDMRVAIEFAPLPVLAFNVAFDQTLARSETFPSDLSGCRVQGYCTPPKQMVYDPVTRTGTYIEGPNLTADQIPNYTASGLSGVWFGVAAQPFAEKFARNHHVTWRLDLAFRTKNAKSNWWTLNDAGVRGASNGGGALKLAAAFSTDNGPTNPYITTTYIREKPITVDYIDYTGKSWGQLKINPADTFVTRAGVELVALDNQSTATRVAFDLYLGFAYNTWEDIPSGFLLPSVLDKSRGQTITHADYISWKTGLGLNLHLGPYVGFRMSGDLTYFTPHTLENIYNVRSDYDTVQIGAYATLDIKIR